MGSHVSWGKEATGTARIAGNKGVVAVYFHVFNTRLAFVAAHLAAGKGDKKTKVRNANYKEAMAGVRSALGPSPALKKLDLTAKAQHVFWLGDLNYRLDLDRETVEKRVETGRYSSLLKHDQLAHQIANGLAFPGYREGKIRFPPTYRYQRESLNFTTHGNPPRVPSYTDRILWRSHPSEDAVDAVHLERYDSVPEIGTSDHKPVVATFTLDVAIPFLPESWQDPIGSHTLILSGVAADGDPVLAYRVLPPTAPVGVLSPSHSSILSRV